MASVTFFKSGTKVPDEVIRKNELKRARHVMALLLEKLGTDGMSRLFSSEITANDTLEKEWMSKSGGRFTPSVAEAHVAEGTGAEFIKWYWDEYSGANGLAMLRAHPEHLGASTLPDGRIGILEVPGHTKLPFLLILNQLSEWKDIPIDLDPNMPHRMMGRVETLDGTPVGYLLHEFRDTNPGFDVKLAIYWPAGAPEQLVHGHSDHLMIEFGNWFELYVNSRKSSTDLMSLALSVNI
ncbi:hypothetical protein ACVBGC_01335 [Burkholderia stagnalis]